MTDYQKASLKLGLLSILIPAASRNGLEKGETITIAEKLFNEFVFKDIADDQKKDSVRTSSGKK
jgi:hypothetical protein